MSRSEFAAPVRRLTRGRMALALGIALAAAAAALALCPLVGARMTGALHVLHPGDVWRGLTGTETDASRIYVIARLPRALAALVVGAGLAAAGCAFQAVLRNPLAEPYTLGISSGASLAAVLAIRFGIYGTVLGATGVSAAALVGAAIAAYLVWRLGRVGGSLPPATLILAGITVAMICSAASMLVLHTSDLYQIGRIIRWLMGGFELLRYPEVARAAVLIGAGLVALLSLARDLNALSAGPDAAASVGVSVTRAVSIAFAACAVIVGASISVGGPIAAVGLIVPHVMRGLVGPDHRVLLPASMLAGGAGLLISDTLARVVVFPHELPVGVITAIFGGGFFLWLLVREKRSSRMWSGS